MGFSSTHTETPQSCSNSVFFSFFLLATNADLSVHELGTMLGAGDPLVAGSAAPALQELSWKP